jgi:hypothetical protein
MTDVDFRGGEGIKNWPKVDVIIGSPLIRYVCFSLAWAMGGVGLILLLLTPTHAHLNQF